MFSILFSSSLHFSFLFFSSLLISLSLPLLPPPFLYPLLPGGRGTQASDAHSTGRILEAIVQMCYDGKDWDMLGEYVLPTIPPAFIQLFITAITPLSLP